MAIIERTLDAAGLSVHYWEAGSENGRALLLLHGGIGDAAVNWQGVMPALAESFHVFAPDLPGFSSSAPLPEMSFDHLLGWLRNFLDALGQTDVVLVGSSSGARLARLFAAGQPQYVPALILVNGGLPLDLPPLVPALIRLPLIGTLALNVVVRIACARQTLDRLVYVQAAVTDDLRQSCRASAPAFARLMRLLIAAPRPAQQTPLVPTLILWGVNDPVMTAADAERLRAEIPGAVLSLIADCGHLPQVEASDTFEFQITSFLDHMSRASLPGVAMLRSDKRLN